MISKNIILNKQIEEFIITKKEIANSIRKSLACNFMIGFEGNTDIDDMFYLKFKTKDDVIDF